jgi:hypothetical protein
MAKKIRIRGIRVRSYLRKVAGRKRRVRVRAYVRRRPKKKKSPRISIKDIQHWIYQSNFKRKEIKALIERHRGKNAFYKALEDYYNRTV